jgi:hypothetical protein
MKKIISTGPTMENKAISASSCLQYGLRISLRAWQPSRPSVKVQDAELCRGTADLRHIGGPVMIA